MREVVGDLWTWDDPPGSVVARVITTNGTVKKDGTAVMGAGVAEQAVELFGDGLPKWLGAQIAEFGNHMHAARPSPSRPYWLLTLPVKKEWRNKADIGLIVQSAQQLHLWVLAMLDGGGTIVLPRPGCGNGGLKWDIVKPVLAPILDQPVRFKTDAEPVSIGDRFVVVENQP